MSDNPYAQSPGQTSGLSASDLDLVEPDRTSLMAIFSLVCSLLCCIPGVGLLGALFGVGAMVSIGGSKGRLGGRGLAIAGLILGLLGTAVWVGVYFAGQAGISQISQYTRFVTLLEQDDVAGARAMVSPTVTVSDEELVAWGDGFEVTHGTFVTQPSGMIEYVSTFVNNTSSNPQLFQAAQQSFPGGSSMMPLPIETTNGQVTVFVIMDQFNPMPAGMPSIVDIGYDDTQGTLVWLVREPVAITGGAGGPMIAPVQTPDADADATDADPADNSEATLEELEALMGDGDDGEGASDEGTEGGG